MTPERELKQVTVIQYTEGTDEYGQIRKNGSSEITIDMAIRVATQRDVNNPIYTDSTHVGISKVKTLTTKDQIRTDTELFNILYVIPSHRYTVYMLKKV